MRPGPVLLLLGAAALLTRPATCEPRTAPLDPVPSTADAVLADIAAAFVEPDRSRVRALAPTLEELVLPECADRVPAGLATLLARAPDSLERRLSLEREPPQVVSTGDPGELSAEDLDLPRLPSPRPPTLEGLVADDSAPLPVGALAMGLLPADCFVDPTARVHRVRYALREGAREGQPPPTPIELSALLLETSQRWYVLDTLGLDEWEEALRLHETRPGDPTRARLEEALGADWVADLPVTAADAARAAATVPPDEPKQTDGRHRTTVTWPRGPDAPSQQWSFVLLRPDGIVLGDGAGPFADLDPLGLSDDAVTCHRAGCAPDESCEAPRPCHDPDGAARLLADRRRGHRVLLLADEGVGLPVVERAVVLLLAGGADALWITDDHPIVRLSSPGRTVLLLLDPAAGAAPGEHLFFRRQADQ